MSRRQVITVLLPTREPELEYGATQKGARGHRWRLTEAGTAALEG
ncbi:hypothetical protein [Streptomyces sp. MBT33]|nr:hypothetical protein [Streptomyces sp. MBT33]